MMKENNKNRDESVATLLRRCSVHFVPYWYSTIIFSTKLVV